MGTLAASEGYDDGGSASEAAIPHKHGRRFLGALRRINPLRHPHAPALDELGAPFRALEPQLAIHRVGLFRDLGHAVREKGR